MAEVKTRILNGDGASWIKATCGERKVEEGLQTIVDMMVNTDEDDSRIGDLNYI